MLLKYPTVTGEKWQSIRLQYDIIDLYFVNEEEITVTCVATDSIISTPIGDFSCYIYNYQVIQSPDVLERLDIYKFIAPGIGEVGQVTCSSNDGRRKFAHIIYEYSHE